MTTPEDMRTDCDRYRETIGADPSSSAGADHAADCAACRAWRDEMRALDTRIAAALAIDVPDAVLPELPDVAEPTVTALAARRPPRTAWLALAASVLVAIVIGWRLAGPDVAQASLAEEVVAHIGHEAFSMQVSDSAVSADRLARVVPAGVARLDERHALVTYAQSCVINGHTVPHLVMQGEHGPVTILLMPEEFIDGPQTIDSAGYRGVILPVGSGSVAIVGDDYEDLESIEKQVLNSVTWST
jgi:hypothetical protein